MDDNKPPFAALMQRHNIGVASVISACNADPYTAWQIINGCPVAREDAERILRGFNAVAGSRYDLDALYCPIKEVEQ